MGIFGWSYPAGASNDPFAPYNHSDPPCDMCGLDPTDCKCPACIECGDIGVPLDHGKCQDCCEKNKAYLGDMGSF